MYNMYYVHMCVYTQENIDTKCNVCRTCIEVMNYLILCMFYGISETHEYTRMVTNVLAHSILLYPGLKPWALSVRESV